MILIKRTNLWYCYDNNLFYYKIRIYLIHKIFLISCNLIKYRIQFLFNKIKKSVLELMITINAYIYYIDSIIFI